MTFYYYAGKKYQGTYICDLYVDEKYRRQGIAASLVKAVLSNPRTEPPYYPDISTRKGKIDNQASYQLFLKLGFKRDELITGDDGKKYMRLRRNERLNNDNLYTILSIIIYK